MHVTGPVSRIYDPLILNPLILIFHTLCGMQGSRAATTATVVRPVNDHKCAAAFCLREANAFHEYPALHLHREACDYLQ